MNRKLPNFNDLLKKLNPKWLIAIGAVGMLLIFLSSIFQSGEKTEQGPIKDVLTASEYASELQNQVSRIVSSISGDKSPTVVVTLDSGTQYVYADDKKNKTTSAEQTAEVSKNGEQITETQTNYVIVEGSDGAEQAVVVTEYMPVVRGVAIVCDGGADKYVQEKIVGAVTAALNISQRKIYVTD